MGAEVDELEEDLEDQFPALKVSSVLKWASLRKDSLINQAPRLVRSFQYYTVFEYRF